MRLYADTHGHTSSHANTSAVTNFACSNGCSRPYVNAGPDTYLAVTYRHTRGDSGAVTDITGSYLHTHIHTGTNTHFASSLGDSHTTITNAPPNPGPWDSTPLFAPSAAA